MTRPQRLGLQPANSPILRKYKLAERGCVRGMRTSSGAAGIPSACKANWQSYPADRKPLSSIFRKRTGRLNHLILQALILKILKRLIRFRKLSALSRRPSVKAKTNWQGRKDVWRVAITTVGRSTAACRSDVTVTSVDGRWLQVKAECTMKSAHCRFICHGGAASGTVSGAPLRVYRRREVDDSKAGMCHKMKLLQIYLPSMN
jgi:hypothetical protein